MPAPDFSPIGEARRWNSDQSWYSQAEMRHAETGAVIRYTVKINAYENQSHGKVETFDPVHLAWNVICSIPGPLLGSKSVSYALRELNSSHTSLIDQDIAILLGRADLILSAALSKAV